MEERELRNNWWFFFPLKGIHLKNNNHNIESPIFGDATIIAKIHVEQVVSMLNLDDKADKNKHASNITYMMRHATFYENFSTFIAVKRTGELSEDKNRQRIIDSAILRGREIASLLTIINLKNSNYKQTCGLVEQTRNKIRSLVVLNFSTGNFRFDTDGHRSFINEIDLIELTYDDINNLLNNEKYYYLSKAIIEYNFLTGSIRRSISQSANRLADAIHSVELSAQVLGSVTSIEILLTEQGDSFETIKRRIIALIGMNSYSSLSVDDVLNARHIYVHRGKGIEDYDLALKSIMLGTNVIINFAELSTKGFKTKKQITDYLDLVYLANEYSKNMDYKLLEELKRMYVAQRTEM